MNLQQNVPLKDHSTMRLGGIARYYGEITSRQDVLDAMAWAKANGVAVRMIGTGSNIVWRDEGFDGLLLVNKVLGYELFDEDNQNVYLTIGGGENWDSIVGRAVAAGLSGIECLSLIPGSSGATPVQNVGAYGQEIAETLVSVEAYDTRLGDFVTIRGDDCGFGYRTSRFKTTDAGRFFIIRLTLHLSRSNPQPPFYSALQSYLSEHGITVFTPQALREAVIAIRRAKLPDPAVVANNGSFFANPVIDANQFTDLQDMFPEVPNWPQDDGTIKLPAAWLVEQAGFKDYHDATTGMATWPTQPLVFVNEHAKTTADLLAFKQKVIDTVRTKFGITLQQEPELLP